MNTENKTWISDKGFFWLVLVISLAVPAVVTLLRYMPEDYRPTAEFAKHLPFTNAVINSFVSVMLIMGYRAIRVQKNKGLHQTYMLAAFSASALFLVSYVVYHTVMPHTEYCGEGFMRNLYLFILLTHIVLAAAILPLILYTIYFSTSGRFERHKKIAKWTFPLWLYVSVTGVVVYIMISPCYNF